MVYEVRQVDISARLLGVAPVLLVEDVRAAAAHYREKLGFEYESFFGKPANFCIIHRDGCSIMLCQTNDKQSIIPHYRVVDRLWNAYFWVDNVQQLYSEMQSRGATIDYGITNTPYGIQEFGIQDLDGYDIGFGQIMD
ncbi:Glyoxalase-like domain protein [Poriferisphaera corsica]|uniref:Glyoxalase-like domain protein n=1 Tax=Poriferisphaera corsica TaxID=2528020 RepID=A0A517YWJ4_9BACT|nr:VOC family protein [Poriferisphaera corsica]QDU34601.1 Glyoxalase-like domain protein [Poriferisphaera corsica]